MICPKCEYERTAADAAPAGECPRCGVVYAKWHARSDALLASAPYAEPEPLDRSPEPALRDAPPASLPVRAARALVAVKSEVGPVTFWGHVAVYAIFFLWGWKFVLADFRSAEAMGSFMHSVDLVFHEAGHILFIPLGDFMRVLGGSLNQLLVPAICAGAFLWKRDNFGAAVCVWWLGQNFVDLAPYIYDASRLVMPLLGGVTGADVPGYHDWANVLGRLDMLSWDWILAKWAARVGAALIVLFMAWGAVLLAKEYRNLDADSYE